MCNKKEQRLSIVWGKCCRYWPLVPQERIGTCGICGAVPVLDLETEDTNETNL